MISLSRNCSGNLNWQNAGKNTCEREINMSMTSSFTKIDTPLQMDFFQYLTNLNSGMTSI